MPLVDDMGLLDAGVKTTNLVDDMNLLSQPKINLIDDMGLLPKTKVDTTDIEPLPEADVSTFAPKEAGKIVLGTGEIAASLATTAVLWPMSKIYGAANFAYSYANPEKAKQAEQDIAQWIYQPKTKVGKSALNLIGTGFEYYLTPTRMAQKEAEKIDPRLGYLVGTIGEVSQVVALGGFGKYGKAKFEKFKNNPIVRKARSNGAQVMDLIKKRRASIDKGILDSEIFIRDINTKLTRQEADALPFLRQKIKDPEVLHNIGRADLIPIIENPSPELLRQTKKVGKYYDEAHKFLKAHYDEVSFVEDYVTHIWDIPKGKKSEVINYFGTKNPFLKQKKIPTLEEGIKWGLKPKTTNIVDILRVYDQYKIKTVHNNKFAEALKEVKDVDGNALVQRIDKAPADWVEFNHPALNRAMAVGKVKGKKANLTVLQKVPVKVHPEIASELKIIFDNPFSHAAVTAFEVVNALTKKSMLSLSLFHHIALTESAFSTGIGTKALKLWNPQKIYKDIKTGNFEIFKQQELAKDAIDHGVTFGALEDVHRGIVEKTLKGVEDKTKNTIIAGKSAKVLRKANQLWDTALWDYYHNSLKLYAYETNVAKALKAARSRYGRTLTTNEIKAVKFEMGKFVNDSFGGQNWELSKIMGNIKMRQMLHWAFLAPDWTLSTIKQATAPVRGVINAARGKPGGVALAKLGTSFWVKAGLYFNTIVQIVNYHNTKKEYGKGRFTWDNPPGHELNMFAGRNKDGTERYIRMGKQFREIMEWFIDPLKKGGAKMSPVIRETFRQVTKHDPGGGYPTEWAEEDNFWKTLIPRAQSILETPIPFSLRPYVDAKPVMFMFALPASKGMTKYKTVKLFKKALRKKDTKQIKRIYFAALENNIDAQSLYQTAKTSVKGDITYDDKAMAQDIFDELKQLKGGKRQDAFDLYVKRNVLTKGVLKQLNNLLEKKASIKKQKKIFNIKGE